MTLCMMQKLSQILPTYDIKLQTHDQYQADTSIILHVLIQKVEIPLKVVSSTFLLVSLASLKESICETRKNVISLQKLFSFLR